MRRIACLLIGVVLLAATVPVATRGASPDGQGFRRIGAPTSLLRPAGAPPPDGVPAGSITVIVTMRSQLDLASIPGAGRPSGRRGIVRALQAQAAAGQRALLRYLDDERAAGLVAGWRPFWVFNGLSVTAAPEVIAAIASREDVASVTSDATDLVPLRKPGPTPSPTPAPTPAPTPTPTPAPTPTPSPTPTPTPTPLPDPTGPAEPNIAAVDAPAMWGLGDTGRGIVVASLDSGVDASHPDLGPRWRGGGNSWFDPYGQHPSTPVDLTGHGTGTMGVIVGGDAGGTTIGMAPGATWIAARIFNDSGTATATAVHAAFQWILDPDGDPATDDAPDVLNDSWAYGSVGCSLEFQLDLQALRASAILPVFAGGNFGPADATSTSPANNPEALAVGAVDATDVVDPLSSRGPSACGEPATTYPELVAPGVAIRSADRYGLYQIETGTSMAAPHVAGALALLLAAHPGLSADEQAAALAAGALDLGPAGPDDAYGAGRLDVLAAHEWLVANPPPPPPAPLTDQVTIPALAKGYGYWVTVTSTASGEVNATWTMPARIQGTLAIYAGNPFTGGSNPAKQSPPSGALATQSGRQSAFSIATASQPPGTYTVYFWAGASVGSSTGTVTTWRLGS
jgi:subtilisin family serine protease